MELASRKVEFAPLSPSTRVDRRDLSDPNAAQRPRWNAAASKGKTPGVLPGGSSLLSLKSYYRKLRTFKGTIKALMSLRRFSGGKKTDAMTLEEMADDSRRATKVVARITADGASLDTLQDQVHSLVTDGHVVTELDQRKASDVSYRQQGNLEHYTEGNLLKRIALQRHPHLVALTQRLWVCAVQSGSNSTDGGSDSTLQFANYEAFMLRLHRLILPEFDVAASRDLIRDDWARDTSGKDHLDYPFFHLSMFELVDLWTDTVDEEDYVSLLYCIMHSLTFAWGDRHLLKPLEDINPVDILEESKRVTAEQIAADLKSELDSAEARVFWGQIVDSTSQAHGERASTAEDGETQRLTTESEATQHRSGSDPASHSVQLAVSSENGPVAGSGTAANAATADSPARDDSKAMFTLGEQLKPVEAPADKARLTGGAASSSDRRRSSGNRMQSATSMASRRASAFKRHTAGSSKSRLYPTSPAGSSPHVVYDSAGVAMNQQSASPLSVKSFGQQQLDDSGATQRTRGASISFESDPRHTPGAFQFDGLQGSALGPMSASARPSGLVADRTNAFLSGRELPHGLGIHSSSAAAGSKADSPRVASFAFAPPLQVASLGAFDPAYHVAVKPTTYALHPSPESPESPRASRPQTLAPTSPRAASASYKRGRQPSTASASTSAAHRPAPPQSLTAPSSPRSRLNILDMEISATGRYSSELSHTGSPRQQQPSGGDASTSDGASLDPMLVTGRAATTRSTYRASTGAMYVKFEGSPVLPRTTNAGGLVSVGLEPRHPQQNRAPTLLDRVIRSRTASTTPLLASKLRLSSSRRIPIGSRPGSSRLPKAVAVSDAAALSVQSVGFSARTPSTK